VEYAKNFAKITACVNAIHYNGLKNESKMQICHFFSTFMLCDQQIMTLF